MSNPIASLTFVHSYQTYTLTFSDYHNHIQEVQDYTQIEILLFFSISGVGSLFLAGDPAQSVEQGTDFRFEEVRAVGYYVAGSRQHLIPDKPKIVTSTLDHMRVYLIVLEGFSIYCLGTFLAVPSN